MFVAKELRKKSIAEYLLYMWQIEDIIRAYGCSLPVIKKNYIERFDFTPEQKDEEIDWFGNLIRMMNEEGKREYGHLDINRVLLQDVIDLHARLLQSSKFPIYNAEYYKVLPFIVELRNRGDKELNEIETCLDALYGVMMLRLQKKENYAIEGIEAGFNLVEILVAPLAQLYYERQHLVIFGIVDRKLGALQQHAVQVNDVL